VVSDCDDLVSLEAFLLTDLDILLILLVLAHLTLNLNLTALLEGHTGEGGGQQQQSVVSKGSL
jgi:hypothetical protein